MASQATALHTLTPLLGHEQLSGSSWHLHPPPLPWGGAPVTTPARWLVRRPGKLPGRADQVGQAVGCGMLCCGLETRFYTIALKCTLSQARSFEMDARFTHKSEMKTSTSSFECSALTKQHQGSWVKLPRSGGSGTKTGTPRVLSFNFHSTPGT